MSHAAFELTTREATQRVEVAYWMLKQAQLERSIHEDMQRDLQDMLRTTRNQDAVLRFLGVLDRHPHAAPEHHTGLESDPAHLASAPSLQPGARIEQLSLADTPTQPAEIFLRRQDTKAAQALPELISTTEKLHAVGQDSLRKFQALEIEAEKQLAEAARITGGTEFATRQLGFEIGSEVEAVLLKHPTRSVVGPTRFARFQQQLDRIHEITFTIASVTERRQELYRLQATRQQALRAHLETTDHRRRFTAELARHRRAFQDQLADIYPATSLGKVRASLAAHTRLQARSDTARILAHDPGHFGALRGLPYSPARQRASEAAQQAAAHLTSFDRIRAELGKLPPRTSNARLSSLRSEVNKLERQIRALPSIHPMQQSLARTVEAVGGIGRIASHLPAPNLAVVDRALRAVRVLGRGLER